MVNHWERSCQQAAARLWGSRDSKHKNDDISFILDPMATKFLRGVCKYINDVLLKGFIISLAGSTGNTVAVNNSAAGREDRDTFAKETSPKLIKHGHMLHDFQQGTCIHDGERGAGLTLRFMVVGYALDGVQHR